MSLVFTHIFLGFWLKIVKNIKLTLLGWGPLEAVVLNAEAGWIFMNFGRDGGWNGLRVICGSKVSISGMGECRPIGCCWRIGVDSWTTSLDLRLGTLKKALFRNNQNQKRRNFECLLYAVWKMWRAFWAFVCFIRVVDQDVIFLVSIWNLDNR